jgi:hypothetical protein
MPVRVWISVQFKLSHLRKNRTERSVTGILAMMEIQRSFSARIVSSIWAWWIAR